jgi:hypothetical protein
MFDLPVLNLFGRTGNIANLPVSSRDTHIFDLKLYHIGHKSFDTNSSVHGNMNKYFHYHWDY